MKKLFFLISCLCLSLYGEFELPVPAGEQARKLKTEEQDIISLETFDDLIKQASMANPFRLTEVVTLAPDCQSIYYHYFDRNNFPDDRLSNLLDPLNRQPILKIYFYHTNSPKGRFFFDDSFNVPLSEDVRGPLLQSLLNTLPLHPSATERYNTRSQKLELKSLNLKELDPSFFNKLALVLPDLKELSLRINFLKTVPETIKNLSNLQRLDLRNNKLKMTSQLRAFIAQLRERNIQIDGLKQLPVPAGEPSRYITLQDQEGTSLRLFEDLIKQATSANAFSLSEVVTFDQDFNLIYNYFDRNNIHNFPRDQFDNLLDPLNLQPILRIYSYHINSPEEEFIFDDSITCSLSEDQIRPLLQKLFNILPHQPSVAGRYNHVQQSLNLSCLHLREIPAEFFKRLALILPKLQRLYLNENQLVSLPNTIGSFSNLQILEAYENQLTALPLSIRNLSNLEELDLHKNRLTEFRVASNLNSLHKLNLEDNQLDLCSAIFICDLRGLQELNLSSNRMAIMPSGIGNLHNLQELHFCGNGLIFLPDGIGNFHNLQKLSLDFNRLSRIPETVGNLRDLEELSLNENGLTTLPSTISNLPNLKRLDLRNNQLRMTSQLRSIISQLKERNIQIDGLKLLPVPAGEQARKLNPQDEDRISKRTFEDLIKQATPANPFKLAEVVALDHDFKLICNYFDLSNIDSFPRDQFDNLLDPNLQPILKIYSYHINSPEEEFIFDGSIIYPLSEDQIRPLLQKLFNMLPHQPSVAGRYNHVQRSLDLAHLNLGEIPAEFFKRLAHLLPNLEKLSLRESHLSSLPNTIGCLRNLKELSLNHNQLTTLPATIGNLCELEELILSSNRITILPDSIGNLRNLQKLYLIFNCLKSLPDTFGNLRKLRVLVLSANYLTSLPDTFGNLNNLQIFEAYRNELTTLPVSIGNLNSLKKLDLHYNQLTMLPDAIGNLSNLNELFLEDNKLKILPSTIANLNNLKEFDIQCNQLQRTVELKELFTQLLNRNTKFTGFSYSHASQHTLNWLIDNLTKS